mmetsp:Transcript_1725/g.3526  ORF Transcript_1725/g.3526 Transcript_1725/m.3526 type:complete len:292 (+) Transcript_1725:242-1117(+)
MHASRLPWCPACNDGWHARTHGKQCRGGFSIAVTCLEPQFGRARLARCDRRAPLLQVWSQGRQERSFATAAAAGRRRRRRGCRGHLYRHFRRHLCRLRRRRGHRLQDTHRRPPTRPHINAAALAVVSVAVLAAACRRRPRAARAAERRERGHRRRRHHPRRRRRRPPARMLRSLGRQARQANRDHLLPVAALPPPLGHARRHPQGRADRGREGQGGAARCRPLLDAARPLRPAHRTRRRRGPRRRADISPRRRAKEQDLRPRRGGGNRQGDEARPPVRTARRAECTLSPLN